MALEVGGREEEFELASEHGSFLLEPAVAGPGWLAAGRGQKRLLVQGVVVAVVLAVCGAASLSVRGHSLTAGRARSAVGLDAKEPLGLEGTACKSRCGNVRYNFLSSAWALGLKEPSGPKDPLGPQDPVWKKLKEVRELLKEDVVGKDLVKGEKAEQRVREAENEDEVADGAEEKSGEEQRANDEAEESAEEPSAVELEEKADAAEAKAKEVMEKGKEEVSSVTETGSSEADAEGAAKIEVTEKLKTETEAAMEQRAVEAEAAKDKAETVAGDGKAKPDNAGTATPALLPAPPLPTLEPEPKPEFPMGQLEKLGSGNVAAGASEKSSDVSATPLLPPEAAAETEETTAEPATRAPMPTPAPATTGSSAGCTDDEEVFASLCYKKCALLTKDEFPHRLSSATCCKTEDPGCAGQVGQSKTSAELGVGAHPQR